jgi:hypothetical protein
MVIVYDLETKEIRYTEDSKIEPELPPGDLSQKIEILRNNGLGFIGIPYELGSDIINYQLNFDAEGNFIGLQPKG